MTQRIFIDIGGYKGHSTLAALDPIFGFDKVYTFEPHRDLATIIRQISDERVVVVNAGLADGTERVQLFGAGDLGASIFENYGPARRKESLLVQMFDANSFLSAIITRGDFVRIKINCEGAEVPIIESLVAAGEEGWLHNALIDFDALRMPEMKERVLSIEAVLKKSSIEFFTPEQVQFGCITNFGGVRNYLVTSGAARRGILISIKSLLYNLKMAFNPEIGGYHKKLILDALPSLAFLARSRRVKSASR